jgi:hypothetical protein
MAAVAHLGAQTSQAPTGRGTGQSYEKRTAP